MIVFPDSDTTGDARIRTPSRGLPSMILSRTIACVFPPKRIPRNIPWYSLEDDLISSVNRHTGAGSRVPVVTKHVGPNHEEPTLRVVVRTADRLFGVVKVLPSIVPLP